MNRGEMMFIHGITLVVEKLLLTKRRSKQDQERAMRALAEIRDVIEDHLGQLSPIDTIACAVMGRRRARDTNGRWDPSAEQQENQTS